MKCAKRN